MPASQIVEECEKLTDLVEASFVISNLVFLYKGGRCSATSALMGTALNIKPGITVKDGKMGVAKKYRGPFEKCLVKYVADQLEGRDDIDTRRIFITHSTAPQELVDKVIALVKELHPFQEVITSVAGCTISSHCGPNCLGVLFFKKN
jgi:DegV family protein with EDD domain